MTKILKSIPFVMLLLLFCLASTSGFASEKKMPPELSSLIQKSKWNVFVFLSMKCPCSQSHEPKIVQLARQFPLSKGFQFYIVHSNKGEAPSDEAIQYFKKNILNEANESLAQKPNQDLGVIYIDDTSNQVLANTLGALKTPHAFILDTKGVILYKGGVDDAQISNDAKTEFLKLALESIVSGNTNYKHVTRSLGCVITR